MPLRSHRHLAVVAALVVSGLLTGCGPLAASPSSAPAHRRSPAAATQTPTPAPTAPPSPSTPSAPASGAPDPSAPASSAGPAVSLPDRLLPAADVPALRTSSAWTAGATRGREGAQPLGTCQKFSMTSIGALQVTVRDYRPTAHASPARAGELVAEFADPQTAARAFAVLESWRAHCDDRLKRYDEHHVGPLQQVPVEDGTGEWYLLDYGPARGAPGSRWFDAQGFVRVQNRIALVSLAEVAKHQDHPADQEPMVAAVRAAALRLP